MQILPMIKTIKCYYFVMDINKVNNDLPLNCGVLPVASQLAVSWPEDPQRDENACEKRQ